jgi:two-component system, NarL family, nitrate/nitrite response regulator NarL
MTPSFAGSLVEPMPWRTRSSSSNGQAPDPATGRGEPGGGGSPGDRRQGLGSKQLPRPWMVAVSIAPPGLAAGIAGWVSARQPGWRVAVVEAARADGRWDLKPAPELLVLGVSVDAPGVVVAVRRVLPGVRVLVLVDEVDPDVEAELVRAGAAGVVSSQCGELELVRAVEAVISGSCVVSTKGMQRATAPQQRERLPVRQREVLELLAEGRQTKEICAELAITPSSVKTHIQRLVDRFGLVSRTELTAQAQQLLRTRVAGEPEGR